MLRNLIEMIKEVYWTIRICLFAKGGAPLVEDGEEA